ncbi:MAG TPA: universal stress protein [Candidatus Limnocylindrales bacterium]|jgi:nucleotide-binding universal stress UspA family protein|nr:universal stress protein [Candidatus Limnocylindrales bacterium]
MRILLAVDGSVSSDRATQLVSTLDLPPESIVRIVSVQEPFTDVLALTWPSSVVAGGTVAETDRQIDTRHRHEAISRAELVVQREGLGVEGVLLRGRPANAIVDEARSFGADLVVLGSRGHGVIQTMVLGSTASEVVDGAPCPVLVARSASLGSIAFADDGSPSARTAETLLATWPLFARRHVDVLSVAETAIPVAVGFVSGLHEQVVGSYAQHVDEAVREVAGVSSATAARLRDAGVDAEGVALEGDPAGEIVRYAAERGTGTIVVGTRGHTGLSRLILGSVARNVLLHAPCSVLVARATAH